MGIISKLRSASVHDRASPILAGGDTSADESPLLDADRSFSHQITGQTAQSKLRDISNRDGVNSSKREAPSSPSLSSNNKRRSANQTTDDALLLRNALTRAVSNEPAIGQGSLTLEQLLPATSRSSSEYNQVYGHQSPQKINTSAPIRSNSVPEVTVQMPSPQVDSPRTPTTIHATVMERRQSASSVISDVLVDSRPRGASFATSDATTIPKSGAPIMQRNNSGNSIVNTARKNTTSSDNSITSTTNSLMAQLSPTKSRTMSNSTPNNKSVPAGGIAGALAMSGVAIAAAGSSSSVMRPSAFTQQPPTLSPNGTRRSRSRGSSFGENNGESAISTDGTAAPDFIGRMPSFDDSSLDVGSTFGFDDGFVGTGYAVASTKRNADFHVLFEAVGEDDFLIEDYGCAIQKEILVQGRLYISEHHLCFNANIFGWVTHLMIPFSEVVSIEKRMTAYVIPNAIQVATLHARYTFASFLARDTTYELLTNIWRISHPNVPTSAALPDHDNDSDDSDERDTGEENETMVVASPSKKRRGLRRKRAKSTVSNPNKLTALPSAAAESSAPQGNPRKCAHKVTDIPNSITQFATNCMDETFSSSPEKIYNLLFVSQAFIKDFWSINQKLTDIQLSDWAPGPNGNLARDYSYIKSLSNPVGPAQTKVLLVDENEFIDYDSHIVTLTLTRTPDVPNGNSFTVKTRTCITWAKNNCCRVRVSSMVDWSGRSLLKGIITNAAMAGQKDYHVALAKEMKSYIQKHISEFQHDQGDGDVDYEVGEEAAAEEPSAEIADDKPTPNLWERYLGPKYGPTVQSLAEPFKDMGEAVLETISTNRLVSAVIFGLLVVNFATYFSKHNAPRLPPGHDIGERRPDQVAEAVRDMLTEYFGQKGPEISSAKRSASEEKADISKSLDALEERIRLLRHSLNSKNDPA